MKANIITNKAKISTAPKIVDAPLLDRCGILKDFKVNLQVKVTYSVDFG